MSDNEYFVEPELLAEFIDESTDALSSVNSLLVKLEKEPENMDLIGSIFRPVHTVKGNSAFFGLMRVKALSHEMETLLDMARKNLLVPTQPIISVLLDGVDALIGMMRKARGGEKEVVDEQAFDKFLEKVVSVKSVNQAADTTKAISEAIKRLEKVQKKLAESQVSEAKEIESIINSMSAFQDDGSANTASYLPKALERMETLLNKALDIALTCVDQEDVFKALTELEGIAEDQETKQTIKEALDEYTTFTRTIGFDPLLCELLSAKAEKLISTGKWKTSAIGKEECNDAEPEQGVELEQAAAPPAEKKKPKSTQKIHKTMRIPEDSIDKFLGYVGELVEIGEMFGHMQRRIVLDNMGGVIGNDFRRVNESLSELSNNLQKSVMEIRKVSMRGILQKVPRMIRDIATSSNKKIDVIISGEDIEVDKSIIDILEGPITHIVRNAADHGVEPPKERENAGKSTQGTIKISVNETACDIILSVEDDGKGIDYDAVKAKAVSMGLIGAGKALTQSDIVDFLFTSGVSTAQEVTDVSGRGVGMDVVKSNVENAGGKINITSKSGKGSVFSIQLPKSVTTQIIDGFIIKAGMSCYVMPLKRIKESFCPEPKEFVDIVNEGECVVRHGKVIPFIRLGSFFEGSGNTAKEARKNNGIMVNLSGLVKPLAVYVDDIIGVQQVVIKQMEGIHVNSNLFSGGAIMGDGKVAMVLDVDNLCGIFSER